MFKISLLQLILILKSITCSSDVSKGQRRELGFSIYMIEFVGVAKSTSLELRKHDQYIIVEDPNIASLTDFKISPISKDVFRELLPDMYSNIRNPSDWVFSIIEGKLSVIENIERQCKLSIKKADFSTCLKQ